MATRNSGKKVAAGITAAVTRGSFSVVGIAAVVVGPPRLVPRLPQAQPRTTASNRTSCQTRTAERVQNSYGNNSGGNSVQPGTSSR